MIQHLEIELGHTGDSRQIVTKVEADGVDLLALGIVKLELVCDAKKCATGISELHLQMTAKHTKVTGPAEVVLTE